MGRKPLAFLGGQMKIGVMDALRSAEVAMQRLGNERAIVLPSLLLCDFGNLEREIAQLEQADVKALHLDVMDGNFVPNLTYGMPIVQAVRRLTDLPIDVHLMMSDPGSYIEQFVDAGADCLTVHAEIANDVGPVLEKIRSAGVGGGIAINPDTPLAAVESELQNCDLLLVMSVNAGFGGQKFQPVALEKLKAARLLAPHLLLEVDGGINTDTISSCYSAGATMFVVGSGIFGQKDYTQALHQLMEALGA